MNVVRGNPRLSSPHDQHLLKKNYYKKKVEVRQITFSCILPKMPPRKIDSQRMLEFKHDLINIGNHTITQIICPFQISDPWETSINNILQHLQ